MPKISCVQSELFWKEQTRKHSIVSCVKKPILQQIHTSPGYF